MAVSSLQETQNAVASSNSPMDEVRSITAELSQARATGRQQTDEAKRLTKELSNARKAGTQKAQQAAKLGAQLNEARSREEKAAKQIKDIGMSLLHKAGTATLAHIAHDQVSGCLIVFSVIQNSCGIAARLKQAPTAMDLVIYFSFCSKLCLFAGSDLQHAQDLCSQQKAQANEFEAALQVANHARDKLQQQVNMLKSDANAIRYIELT